MKSEVIYAKDDVLRGA